MDTYHDLARSLLSIIMSYGGALVATTVSSPVMYGWWAFFSAITGLAAFLFITNLAK